jgi:hypothetical protein
MLTYALPFTVSTSEYLRDCGFYFSSLILTVLILYDGHMSAVEGGMFLALYLAYVLVVVHFERVLTLLGMPPLAGAHNLLSLLVHKYKYRAFREGLDIIGHCCSPVQPIFLLYKYKSTNSDISRGS